MPQTYTTLGTLFTAIADAIRAKKGTTGNITADDFPAEIASIQTGGGSIIPSSIQNDGKTYIGIHIPDGSPFKEVKIIVYGTSSSMRATLDWGDGSSTVSLSGSNYKTNTHTYSTTGDKIITINATAGTVRIGGGTSYRLYGSGSDTLNGVMRTYIQWIIVGNRTQVSGTYGLYYAVGLQEVRFYTSYSSQTSVANYFFNYCYSLKKITLTSYITSLGESSFASCYCLEEIELPPNLTTISASCFANCNMLQHITIPSKVTTIGASAFNNSYAISKIRFEASTPPTVSNSNAFTGLPAGCIISVPTGKLSAYTGAANYPSSSTYTYIEEAS